MSNKGIQRAIRLMKNQSPLPDNSVRNPPTKGSPHAILPLKSTCATARQSRHRKQKQLGQQKDALLETRHHLRRGGRPRKLPERS